MLKSATTVPSTYCGKRPAPTPVSDLKKFRKRHSLDDCVHKLLEEKLKKEKEDMEKLKTANEKRRRNEENEITNKIYEEYCREWREGRNSFAKSSVAQAYVYEWLCDVENSKDAQEIEKVSALFSEFKEKDTGVTVIVPIPAELNDDMNVVEDEDEDEDTVKYENTVNGDDEALESEQFNEDDDLDLAVAVAESLEIENNANLSKDEEDEDEDAYLALTLAESFETKNNTNLPNVVEDVDEDKEYNPADEFEFDYDDESDNE